MSFLESTSPIHPNWTKFGHAMYGKDKTYLHISSFKIMYNKKSMLYEENPWLKHIENMGQRSAHHYLPNKKSLVKVTMWMCLYFKMEENMKHWNECLEIRKYKRVHFFGGGGGGEKYRCMYI